MVVEELVPPTQKLEETHDPNVPVAQPKDILEYGYLIGVKEDGTVVFKILGEAGAVELMGLHEIADRYISYNMDKKFSGLYNDFMKALDEIIKDIKNLKS